MSKFMGQHETAVGQHSPIANQKTRIESTKIKAYVCEFFLVPSAVGPGYHRNSVKQISNILIISAAIEESSLERKSWNFT